MYRAAASSLLLSLPLVSPCISSHRAMTGQGPCMDGESPQAGHPSYQPPRMAPPTVTRMVVVMIMMVVVVVVMIKARA